MLLKDGEHRVSHITSLAPSLVLVLFIVNILRLDCLDAWKVHNQGIEN